VVHLEEQAERKGDTWGAVGRDFLKQGVRAGAHAARAEWAAPKCARTLRRRSAVTDDRSGPRGQFQNHDTQLIEARLWEQGTTFRQRRTEQQCRANHAAREGVQHSVRWELRGGAQKPAQMSLVLALRSLLVTWLYVQQTMQGSWRFSHYPGGVTQPASHKAWTVLSVVIGVVI
jgi:hypothetical protein